MITASVCELTERLSDYSWRLTQSSRDFMEGTPFLKLPDDYVRYPGKMDHTSVVCVTAAGNALLGGNYPLPNSNPLSRYLLHI